MNCSECAKKNIETPLLPHKESGVLFCAICGYTVKNMGEGEIYKRFRKGSGEQTEQGVPVAWWYPNGKTVMRWVVEMEKDFKECCSLQDYLITVKRWFGEKK